MPVIGQRLRIICDSMKGLKVNPMIRNKKGFTLIELIITMFILTVVMGLVAGLVTNSMKFFSDERTQVNNQASLRLIAVDFEKDVRKYVLGVDQFSVVDGCYQITPEIESNISYCLVGNNLTRNGVLIGEQVSQFTAVYNSTNNSIALTIRSLPDGYGRVNEVIVNIYIRIMS